MKCFALTLLFLAFAFSNCEPVEYADKEPVNKSAENFEKAEPPKSSESGDVARVVGISDGDSMVVLMEGKIRKRVRLATIDAPERGQAFGTSSRKSLSDLVYNKEVRVLTEDVDQYGRIVGEVYVGDVNVNIEQIRRGYAWHYRRHARQQSQLQRRLYSAAEREAREKKAGLWRDEDPLPPWEYRKRNRRE